MGIHGVERAVGTIETESYAVSSIAQLAKIRKWSMGKESLRGRHCRRSSTVLFMLALSEIVSPKHETVGRNLTKTAVSELAVKTPERGTPKAHDGPDATANSLF